VTKLDKLIAHIINNPKNVNFDELDKVLKHYGFNCRQSGGGSSHYVYFHSRLQDILTIPKNRPIKAIYVKKAVEAIEQLERGEE
jgi:RNA recognition motif-containing protein